MPSSWWYKSLAVIGLVLAALYYLIPTLAGWPAPGTDEELPEIATYFPDNRLRLGLDLQGGIDLTLEVDIDAALANKVQRDIRQVENQLEKSEVPYTKAFRPEGSSDIALVLEDDGDLPKARKAINAWFVNVYEFDRVEDIEGESASIFILTDLARADMAKGSVEQVIETLRNRIDQFGVSEPSITSRGENRINVQLPGLADPERAIELIGKTAQLEFRMVNRKWGDAARLGATIERAKAEAGLTEDFTDEDLNRALEGKIPGDTSVLWEKKFDSGSQRMARTRPWLVFDKVSLTGELIEHAQVSQDQFGVPNVSVEFNGAGAKIFGDLTTDNVGELMAIILDGTVNSAPQINEPITGGRASISMGGGGAASVYQEARDLALVLRAGALPAPIRIMENRTVGASLGADSVKSGLTSFLIGSILVLIFMVIYYNLSGLVANTMLILNVIFLMALLATLGATLTLPGIAGIVLTVGMAVDANVIIFERIREELRLGRAAAAAVEEGYAKALSAILDANITTFIAAAVLYSYGSGPVKGFAVTLMVGILTSVVTAVIVSRLVFDLILSKGSSKRLSI